MTQKKKSGRVKAWILIQSDVQDVWDGTYFFTRGHAQKHLRGITDKYNSFKKFLKVVPCTISFSLPLTKEK